MKRGRDVQTPDLFTIPAAAPLSEGSLNFATQLRALLSQVLKHCPHSRYQVAARMSELLGADVSKFQLDAWTAESREPWRFPLEYAPAFEAACESFALTEWLADKRGGQVLFGKEALMAEMGRLQRQHDDNQRRMKALRRQMGEHDA